MQFQCVKKLNSTLKVCSWRPQGSSNISGDPGLRRFLLYMYIWQLHHQIQLHFRNESFYHSCKTQMGGQCGATYVINYNEQEAQLPER